MSDESSKSHFGYRLYIVIVVVAPLTYQFAFYLTYRSVIDSYGLGYVEFPDAIAQPVFTPARLLDEHVLGLNPRIRKFSKSIP